MNLVLLIKFAQARFYNAKAGRFQSEDIIKGFKNAPYTLNHYSYCFGNPVGFSDKNGKLPGWMEDAWDTACDVAGDVKDVASDAWDATCDFAGDVYDVASDFVNENKEVIVATAAAGVAMATAVAKYGVVGGIGAGVCILAGGVAMASIAYQKGEDIGSAFSRGIADTSIILTAAVLNPIGTAKGLGTQATVDYFMGYWFGDEFDPETYVAAAVGGAVGDWMKLGGGTVGNLASFYTNTLLKYIYSGEGVFSMDNKDSMELSLLVGLIMDSLTLLGQNLSLGEVERIWDVFTDPLSFLKDYDFSLKLETYFNGFLRALTGINNGTSTLSDVLNTLAGSLRDNLCND